MSVLQGAYNDLAAINSKLRAEIDRLRAIIARIDAINDNPADFNSEINRECDKVLRPHLVEP